MYDSVTSATDRWMLSRLSAVVDRCESGFKTYNLTDITRCLHTFWWADFCDVYLVMELSCYECGVLLRAVINV